MMFSYCLFISMLTMLRSIYLLNDEANLPLYLKGKSGWSLPNESLGKVRKSYGLGLLSSHELMHDVSLLIAGVMSLSLCCMHVKEKGGKS